MPAKKAKATVKSEPVGKVAGIFRPSSRGAKLYNLFADGKPHTEGEARKVASGSEPVIHGRILRLQREGKANGKWTMEDLGDGRWVMKTRGGGKPASPKAAVKPAAKAAPKVDKPKAKAKPAKEAPAEKSGPKVTDENDPE